MAFAVLLMMVSGLAGCSTSQIDALPQGLGGLPEGAPKRAETPPVYPAVHDVPPARSKALMDKDEQKRLEADLVATRTRLQNQQKKLVSDAKGSEKGSDKGASKDKPAPAERAAAKSDRPTVKRGRRPTALADDNASNASPAGPARQAPANPAGGGNAPAWPAPPAPDATGFGRNP